MLQRKERAKLIERMEPQRNPAVVLIAAMPGELAPLMRTWAALATVDGVAGFQHPSNTIFAFHAGMGAQHATRAFARAQQVCEVRAVYSVGWAGGLVGSAHAGNVMRAHSVRDLATGEVFRCTPSEWATHGMLLTARRIAAREHKLDLAARYADARMVDMEAATVARLALAHGLPFRCVKAVSDALIDELPDLNPFVRDDGTFAQASFAMHVALRPRHWADVARFGRQARLAAANLCDSLAGELGIEKPR